MKKLFFLFIIFFYTCKKSNNNDKIIINDDFKNIISNYIESYPIKNQKMLFDKEIAFPSYHIYFDKKNKDTIVQ